MYIYEEFLVTFIKIGKLLKHDDEFILHLFHRNGRSNESSR